MKGRFNQLTIYLILACVVFYYLMLAALVFSAAPHVPASVNIAWPYLPVVELYLATIVIGYFLGSLPFGLWITNAITGRDVRKVGSGKTGMTNVMRVAGRKAAAFSLILDMAKSAFAVLCAYLVFSSGYAASHSATIFRDSAMALGAISAITGHTWSMFLKFKGGRGVSTFIGGLLAMYWQAAVIGGIVTLGIGFRTKYMSMGSIIGAVTAFIVLMSFSILRITFLGPYPDFAYVLYAMVGAIFIYVIHRDNIIRLFNGTERKIEDKSKSKTGDNSTPSGNPQ
jgi:glycerol-3-phosphate acyltransferase PlsY